MSDLRQAAQQALEAMLNFPDDISDEMFESIRALRAALAQQPEPAQEPMAWDGRCMLGHCNSPAGCENSGECRAIERKVRGEKE